MLKSLALAVVVLAGTAAAASEGIEVQDQIYVVAGVLGGVCLLLTIAAIFSIVATIKLQTKVAVLQSSTKAAAMEPPPSNLLGGSGSLLRESRQLETQPQPQPQQRPPQMGLPRTDVNRYSSPPREDPYRSPPRDDPYRAPTRESRPAPPPRPYRAAPAREYY